MAKKKDNTPKLKKDGTPKKSGGARKNAGRKSSYESYSRQYDAAQAEFARQGVTMHQVKYTKDEWEAQHERLKNDRIAEGRKPGNINRDLVEKQKYGLTKKQVDAVLKDKKKELRKAGYSEIQIRSGFAIEAFEAEKVMEYMKENPEHNINQALEYARAIISTEFFGS